MINSLKLKFGRAEGLPPETVTTTPITVFVGPNNSGKSLILKEIQQFCTNGKNNINGLVIDSIELSPIPEEEVDELIDHHTLTPNKQEHLDAGYIIVGKTGHRNHVVRSQLRQSLIQPSGQERSYCRYFLSYNTLVLDGRNRIDLVKQQSGGDLQQPAQTSFQVLFRNNEKRKQASKIIYEAFGEYLVVDPTNLGQLKLRLSSIEPKDEMTERGLHQDAVDFHKAAKELSESSDGVKAFVGMITELIAGDPVILSIDEPEAFLHPSLSYKLGKYISDIMSSSNKRVFVSTHSPNFVMGCIQSGAPVNIVRLTYRNAVPTARVLPNADILKLMRNPLLRSTGVLSGLFYEFVVVTEADADRAFYQEINERLVAEGNGRGIPNCLFLNAQNKQTVKTIIKPLRKLGIPVAGIVDVDVLKEGGTVWKSFLNSGFIPEIEQNPLGVVRSSIKTELEKTGKNMKRDGGISILDGEEREAAENLFEKLSDYGLFVVPSGELESWLSDLNVSGHGPDWLINIFKKMGEDPLESVYVSPDSGDVWDFMSGIKSWFFDQRRKGIPR